MSRLEMPVSEINIEAYEVFKVTKAKDEEIGHIRLSVDPQILKLMKENLVGDLLKKKLSKRTQTYFIEGDSNPVKSVLDKLLKASRDDFSKLAIQLADKYKEVERSRRAILVILSFTGSRKHIGIFKLPPHPSMIVEGERARYAPEAFERYQKAIVYPDITESKDVKVTQRDTYSDYLLKLLNVKTEQTPEETLYDMWEKNPDMTFADLKSLIKKYPAIKKAHVRVQIGEHTFSTEAGNIEKQLGRLNDIHAAILDGNTSFIKISSKATIQVNVNELDDVRNIIKSKGG